MTALSSSQTAEILERYRARKHLNKAAPLLARSPKERSWILRAHYLPKPRGGPIWDADEIADRDNADSLLELASVLEVMAVATGQSPQVPPKSADRLASFLANPEVCAYYETHYPLALPTLFRMRASGKLPPGYEAALSRASTGDLMSVIPHLISFFELDERRIKNKHLGLFLDLIDDFSTPDGEIALDDVLDLLDDPQIFEQRAIKQRGGSSSERQALRGLDDFMRFATDYHVLLQRLEDRPLLRSAIWLHNCYWFGVGGGSVQRTAQRVQKRLHGWAEQVDDPGERTLVRARVEATAALLRDLAQWQKHAEPIVKAAKPALSPWSKAVASERRRRN